MQGLSLMFEVFQIARRFYVTTLAASQNFIVDGHSAPKESTSSSKILEYPGQVNQEDSSSYFVTPPGPLRKKFPANKSPERPGRKKGYCQDYNHQRNCATIVVPAPTTRQRCSSNECGPVWDVAVSK